MRHEFLAVFFVIANLRHTCDSFRVLGLFPLPIKSHYIFYETLMKELAKRGHEVHVVSHFPQKIPIPNLYDININGSLPRPVDKVSIQTRIHRGIWGTAKHIFRTCGSDICEYIFKHQSIINLKDSNLKFDVMISELYGTDCLLVFAHHFNVPIIGMSGTDMLPWASVRLGNPDNPSHIPNYFVATNHKMVLYEKLQVIGAQLLTKIGYFFISTAPSEMRAREFFGKHIPSLDSLVYNTSIILLNSHLSVTTPRAMVPGIIEVGGLHIKTPQSLSREIDAIVSSAKDGIIYFSMGTVINMKTFPLETLYQIISAFSRMPQKIIWSGTLDGVVIPENVYVIPWVEQVDLLCHPKLRAFVTHGGLMSIHEAAFCGTPILGIPIFPNQERDVAKFVDFGAGLIIYYEYLTEEEMKESLDELVTNKTYKEQAKKLSKIFKDRPVSPLDAAVYWTEYVVKFQGAPHLKTKSAELVWFEYYLVDCIIIIILMLVLVIYVLAIVLNFLQNYIDDVWFYRLSRKTSKKDESELETAHKEAEKEEIVKAKEKDISKEKNKEE